MGKIRLANVTPLEEFFENKAKSWAGTWSGPAYSTALEQVKAAPTVEAVEVVHGEWIDGYAVEPETGRIIYKSIDCSVCEEVFKIESNDREYWKKRFKRCFCCGAKMDGGKDNGKK